MRKGNLVIVALLSTLTLMAGAGGTSIVFAEASGPIGVNPAPPGAVYGNPLPARTLAGGERSGPDVLLIGDDAAAIQDVHDRIMETGKINSATTVNVHTDELPTLEDLEAYDAVMLWAGHAPPYAGITVTLGDLLADYADAGGGVVIATFVLGSNGGSWNLGGRFNADYQCIIPVANQTGGVQSLGVVHVPDHPLMADVTTFAGGTSSYRVVTGIVAEAIRIADWTDGLPLIATRFLPHATRVDLNMYPPSDIVRSDFWSIATDGGHIMANALVFVAEAVTVTMDANATTVDAGELVVFSSTVTGSPESYLWNFGDPDWTSTLANPVFRFPTAGNYDVTLEVTGTVNTATAGPLAIEALVPDEPDEPRHLVATPVSDTEIHLEWDDRSDNENSFLIYRAENLQGFSEIGSVTADEEEYVDDDLDPATQYSYYVTAWNNYGGDESGPSQTIQTFTFDSSPDPPENVTATTRSHARIDLAWDDVSDNEDQFYIYRKRLGVIEFVKWDSVDAGVSVYLDSGLDQRTQYLYQISAVNGRAFWTGGESIQVPATATTHSETLQVDIPLNTSGATGTDFSLELDIPDDGLYESFTLNYRQAGESDWSEMAFTESVKGTWVVVIEADDLDITGLQYFIEALFDTDETITYPANAPENFASMPVTFTDNPTLNLSERTYALASIPFTPEDGDPSAIFDELGGYGAKTWKFGIWDGTAGESGTYIEYPDAGSVAPGVGFWVASQNAATILVDGTSTPADASYEITLRAGFNQIGNPFAFSVPWAAVDKGTAVTNYLYGWNGHSYVDSSVTLLEPGKGYWVECSVDGHVLEIPLVVAGKSKSDSGRRSPDRLGSDEAGWSVNVRASVGSATDNTTRFGVREGATAARDHFDFLDSPAPPGGYVSVSLVDDDGRRLLSDYRDPDAAGQTWELALDSDLSGQQFRVEFIAERELPSGWRIVAIDRDNLLETDITAGRELGGRISDTDAPRSWQIVAGTVEYLATALESITTEFNNEVSRFQFYPAYPNPFRTTTGTVVSLAVPRETDVSFRIYDLQGRLVRTLQEGVLGRGIHRFTWNGDDGFGRRVASGVYFVRVLGEDLDLIRKVALLR